MTTSTIGLLHDLIEDTSYTLEDLRNLGFDGFIQTSVEAISRRPDESYFNYITRMRHNFLACRVKVLDICDNIDRLPTMKDDLKRQSLTKRYRKALSLLLHTTEQ